jgi:hypothetical protein
VLLKIVIGLRLLKYIPPRMSMPIGESRLLPTRSSNAWRKPACNTTRVFFTCLTLDFTYAACADSADVQIISV